MITLKTNLGDIKITLDFDKAPVTAKNFQQYVEDGFYNGTIFHRVIKGFMAQGGDPIGNGTGNPGYKYDGEFDGGMSHNKPGMLSMANSGPGTDGSQFFITFLPTPFLDGKHTVFGKVVIDVEGSLTKIEALGSRRGKTTETVKIIKATIRIANKK